MKEFKEKFSYLIKRRFSGAFTEFVLCAFLTILVLFTVFFINISYSLSKDNLCRNLNLTYSDCDEFYNLLYANITQNITSVVVNNITNNITYFTNITNNITYRVTDNITNIAIINSSDTYTKSEIDAKLKEKEALYNMTIDNLKEVSNLRVQIVNNSKQDGTKDFTDIAMMVMMKQLGLSEPVQQQAAQQQQPQIVYANNTQTTDLQPLKDEIIALRSLISNNSEPQKQEFPYPLIAAALLIGAAGAYYYKNEPKKPLNPMAAKQMRANEVKEEELKF